MKTNNFVDEAIAQAQEVAGEKDLYIWAALGGVLKTITTRSVVQGLNHSLWGMGMMIAVNVAVRMTVDKAYNMGLIED